jgi:hypothetical protein
MIKREATRTVRLIQPVSGDFQCWRTHRSARRRASGIRGALWDFPAITPLGGICTWKSGAAPSRFLPRNEAETRIPVVPKRSVAFRLSCKRSPNQVISAALPRPLGRGSLKEGSTKETLGFLRDRIAAWSSLEATTTSICGHEDHCARSYPAPWGGVVDSAT